MMLATTTSSGSAISPAMSLREDEVAHRIGREGGQRVDLLGDAHGAELGRHRRTDPAGDHQPGENGAQLADDREHDDGRNGALRLEALEAGVALQRQHHAGEDRGQAHHRQRVVADLDHLAQQLAAVDRAGHAVADRLAGEERDAADRLAHGEHRCTDDLQGIGHGLPGSV